MLLPDTPAGVRDSANGDIDDLVSAVAALQSNYLAAHGQYWQGLATHAVVPADAAEVAPDQLGIAPVGQTETWNDFGVSLPATTAVSLYVDRYDGPAGKGYVVAGTIVLGGITYTRKVNVGPETYLATDGWETIDAIV